jgi:hypothetical protein
MSVMMALGEALCQFIGEFALLLKIIFRHSIDAQNL